MTKEEIENIVKNYDSQRLSLSGSSLKFIDFKDNSLKLKFDCSDKTEFKVQGKVVTMADETKKSIEKYLQGKIGKISVIFI